MELSRSNFLDLLKGNNSATSENANKKITLENNKKKTSNINREGGEDKEEEEEEDEGHEESGIGSTSWSVLKDSYLTVKSLALKVDLFLISNMF